MSNNEKKLAIFLYSQSYMQHHIFPCEQGRRYALYYPNDSLLFAYIWYENTSWWLQYTNEQTVLALSFQHLYTHMLSEKRQVQMMLNTYVEQSCILYPYTLTNGMLLFGRGKKNHVCITHPYVSSIHASLSIENHKLILKDCDSSNGIYVNRKRVYETSLFCGDVIFLMDMMFIVGDGFLMIPTKHAAIQLQHVSAYKSKAYKALPYKATNWTHAMPFPIPQWLSKQQYVEAPIVQPKKESTPLWVVLGPSFMMGSASMSMGIFSLLRMQQNTQDAMQAIPAILMSFSMALSTILWPVLNRKYERQKQAAYDKAYNNAYMEYLDKIHAENLTYSLQKKTYINTYYESTQIACSYLENKTELLFHRRIQDSTWMYVVLGTGNQNAEIKMEYPKQGIQIHSNVLYDKMQEIVLQAYVMKDVHIRINMLETRYLGVVAHEKTGIHYTLMLLLQLVLLHDKQTLHVMLFIDEETACDYGLFWIPQLYFHGRKLLISNHNDASSLQEHMYKHKDSFENTTLLIVSFQMEWEHAIPIVQTLLDDNCMSCCYIQYGRNQKDLKTACHSYVVLDDKENYVFDNQHKQIFQETFLSKSALVTVFRRLSQFDVQPSKKPRHTVITFLDLFASGHVKQLKIQERWKQSVGSNSLQAIIGFDQHYQSIYLDIHEHAHGPHGLIAGTTGSGKSECILTYIMSMAISYSSEQVAFFLMDYKGGMSTSMIEKLPHFCGVLTNLDENMLMRTYFALEHEVTSRQQRFVQAAKAYQLSSVDIDQYQKLRIQHEDLPPIPHLIIIADEFAELKMQHPDFLDRLKQIARIGRSLGIHLILATQKPGGIVDEQIWSNARFHLCLKVQERSDSMEILKRDDAVYLRESGAFCFQVGHDEIFITGQSAWTQAPYYEQNFYDPMHIDEITFMDMTLQKKEAVHIHKMKVDQQSQLQAVIHEVCLAHQEAGYKCMHFLEKPLSETTYIDDVPVHEKNIPLGILDDVQMGCQSPFYIPMYRSFFVYADVANDRLWFLQNYILGCLRQPQRLRMYVFDFEENLPQAYQHSTLIHDVVYVQDQEKAITFFHHIQRLLDCMSVCDTSPTMIVLHGYELFHERFSEWEPLIIRIVREGAKKGLFCMILFADYGAVNFRLQAIIPYIYVMNLRNKQDYYGVLQTKTVFPIKQKGSGVFEEDAHAMLFQLGIYKQKTYDQLLKIKDIQKHRIPVLPKKVKLGMFTQEGLCLGIDDIYKEPYILKWDAWKYIFIFSNMSIPNSMLTYLKKQLQFKYQDNFVFGDFQQDFTHLSYTKEVRWGNKNDAITCKMNKDKTNSLEVIYVLIGQNAHEIAYTLELQLPLQKNRLTKQQAYVWRRENMQCIHIVEEEKNG